MDSSTEKLVEILAENQIVKEEDRPLYEYGFHQLWFTLLNLITDVAIGVLTGMLWESLLFLAAYISVRKFAGGFHARTELRCYGLSTLLLCVSLLAIYGLVSIEVAPFGLLFLFAFAGLAIVLLAPVGSASKPLDSTERLVFRKRTKAILALHAACFAGMLATGKTDAAAVITVADAAVSVMLVPGVLK